MLWFKMDLNEPKFNQMFLKNFFKEILNEKEKYPEKTLEQMCEILADAFISEFGSDGTLQSIISRHGNVEDWLMKKIESLTP